MKIKNRIDDRAFRKKFFIEIDGQEVGRASLYVLFNDLHEEPYGLLEDVFVDEECRRQGYGRALVQAVIDEAKFQKCYKLIATSRASRPEVHALYEKFGFQNYGFEFRMNLN